MRCWVPSKILIVICLRVLLWLFVTTQPHIFLFFFKNINSIGHFMVNKKLQNKPLCSSRFFLRHTDRETNVHKYLREQVFMVILDESLLCQIQLNVCKCFQWLTIWVEQMPTTLFIYIFSPLSHLYRSMPILNGHL